MFPTSWREVEQMKQEQVFAQLPTQKTPRWFVGYVQADYTPDLTWVGENTGLKPENVSSIDWNKIINAWVIKIKT